MQKGYEEDDGTFEYTCVTTKFVWDIIFADRDRGLMWKDYQDYFIYIFVFYFCLRMNDTLSLGHDNERQKKKENVERWYV